MKLWSKALRFAAEGLDVVRVTVQFLHKGESAHLFDYIQFTIMLSFCQGSLANSFYKSDTLSINSKRYSNLAKSMCALIKSNSDTSPPSSSPSMTIRPV